METAVLSRELPTAHEIRTILSVGLDDVDHGALEAIIDDASAGRDSIRWSVRRSGGVAHALEVLRNGSVPVVLCESELVQGSWRDLLDAVSRLPNPPMLVVTSRLADNYLWAEALNLGAYDVLAKPFYDEEVVRTLRSAWRRYEEGNKPTSKTKKARMKSSPAPLALGSPS